MTPAAFAGRDRVSADLPMAARVVNLYKTGSAYAMHGRAVPPLWIPALRGRRDFHSAPAYRNLFYAFNTSRPPFDNALVRYAFHMATDKHEIMQFLGGGQTPARTVVPPFGGYEGVGTLARGGRRADLGCSLLRSRSCPRADEDAPEPDASSST